MSVKKLKTIRWLHAARDDLDGIIEPILFNNAIAAEKLAERILNRIEVLAQLPYLGPVSPYAAKVRYLVIDDYVVYCTVHRSEVVIRAIVHGSRFFQRAWLRRK